MTRQFHRPARLDPEIAEAIEGGEDPAVASELAHRIEKIIDRYIKERNYKPEYRYLVANVNNTARDLKYSCMESQETISPPRFDAIFIAYVMHVFQTKILADKI